jgi:hypothetical protein
MTNEAENLLSDKQIVQNLKNELTDIKQEIFNILEFDYNFIDNKKCNNILKELRTKQYLIEKILGYE